jgi:hypothetical protein
MRALNHWLFDTDNRGQRVASIVKVTDCACMHHTNVSMQVSHCLQHRLQRTYACMCLINLHSDLILDALHNKILSD